MTSMDDLTAEAAMFLADFHGEWNDSQPIGMIGYTDEAFDLLARVQGFLRERGLLLGPDGLLRAEPVGVDYCTAHSGVRNEDEAGCDFADEDCEACDGTGAAEDDDPGGGTFDCAVCDGTGLSPCRLLPAQTLSPLDLPEDT